MPAQPPIPQIRQTENRHGQRVDVSEDLLMEILVTLRRIEQLLIAADAENASGVR